MAQPDLQEQLNRLLDLAHHQVHFAEAKNGALLTLNFALIVGMVSISSGEFSWQWRVYMFAIGATLGLAGLVSFASFLPRLRPIRDEKRADGGNVAFTGDIAKMGSEALLLNLSVKMGISDKPSAYCLDIADQTYANARIAERKFRRFRLATVLTLVGIIAPTLWIVREVATGALILWS